MDMKKIVNNMRLVKLLKDFNLTPADPSKIHKFYLKGLIMNQRSLRVLELRSEKPLHE